MADRSYPTLRALRTPLALALLLVAANAAAGETEAPAQPPADAPVSLAIPAEPTGQATPTTDPSATATVGDAAAPEQPPEVETAAGVEATEGDFQALYGEAGGTQAVSAVFDPWERFNRRVHHFNNGVDRIFAKPLAQAYVKVVPRPVRHGVGNFFSNLGQPASAVNAALQGKPRQAAHSLGRFVVNTTVGIGGVFDPATSLHLRNLNEDFGQTLGTWGWKRSRYLELPLLGPRTVRDVVGMVGDAPVSVLRQIEPAGVRAGLQALQLVDLRTNLLSTDALRENVQDDYALVRDAWSQRRDFQIRGDASSDSAVPQYLDEGLPEVPAEDAPSTGKKKKHRKQHAGS